VIVEAFEGEKDKQNSIEDGWVCGAHALSVVDGKEREGGGIMYCLDRSSKKS